jgi:hypothetical protein
VPPEKTIADHADDILRNELRRTITERILREADVDAQVDAAFAGTRRLELPPAMIAKWLEANPVKSWRDGVEFFTIGPGAKINS